MRAQLTFTPTESKKFIGRALAQSDLIQNAVSRGTVAIHPSSSTYFLTEALLGSKPPSNVWVCGVVAPKALCLEAGTVLEPRNRNTVRSSDAIDGPPSNPGGFKHTQIIRQGELRLGVPLDDMLAELGPDDVYVKGVNALDVDGNVGVLTGNRVEGGTIGRVMAASRRQGFTVICPVGIEKLIPVPVREAAKIANRKGYSYAMGMPCSLHPVDAHRVEVVTEVRAVALLCGARGVPVSAGGLGGAEGALTMAVEGDEQQLAKVVELAEACKGAQLPPLRLGACADCPTSWCTFPVGNKHWAVV